MVPTQRPGNAQRLWLRFHGWNNANDKRQANNTHQVNDACQMNSKIDHITPVAIACFPPIHKSVLLTSININRTTGTHLVEFLQLQRRLRMEGDHLAEDELPDARCRQLVALKLQPIVRSMAHQSARAASNVGASAATLWQ